MLFFMDTTRIYERAADEARKQPNNLLRCEYRFARAVTRGRDLNHDVEGHAWLCALSYETRLRENERVRRIALTEAEMLEQYGRLID